MSRRPVSPAGRTAPVFTSVPAGVPIDDAARSEAARRVRLEPFYLDWRADRQRYSVCWYDSGARTRRRVITGIGAGAGVDPPIEARQALAAHFAVYARPAAAQPTTEAGVSGILSRYLAEHCTRLRAPHLPATAAMHLERFFAEQRKSGALPALVSVADINARVVQRYIGWRQAAGVVGETINRELSTLRGALNWAWKNEIIQSAPFIASVPEDRCSGPRDLEWSQEQVAAILEAAWADEWRHHLHLFTLTSLSTHFRTEAILELDLDQQLKGDRLHSLRPGEKQTRKRRSTVPVVPTLADWLQGRTGKLIRFRVPIAEKYWADAAVPEWHARDTASIKTGFAGTIVAAGLAHPSLGLVEPLLDARGNQVMREFTRRDPATGQVPAPAAQWRPVGSPNTLRHSLHTYLQARGVPQAQIDMAAGHSSEKGSGRNYTHLRPDYLREFSRAIEDYWRDLDALTTVHRRTQGGPKIIYLATARPQGGK
jgi:site-specific recombinase XerD